MKQKKCSETKGCSKLKDVSCFTYMPSKKGYYYLCKDCVRAYNKRYYNSNRENLIKANLQYRLKNPELIKKRMSESGKKRYRDIKSQVFDVMGRKCNCCGENNESFLCVDHINDNGSQHRKEIKSVPFGIYGWLVKNNFPEGFQILCHNCNFSKSANNGICAHKLTERSTTIPRGSTLKRVEVRDTQIG